MKVINTLKEHQNQARATYLRSINKKLHLARASNNGRVTYGLVQSIVNDSKKNIPQLTRSVIKKSFKAFMMKKKIHTKASTETTLLQDTDSNEVANALA